MSFTRAPVKRFNDGIQDTPGPVSYDPKMPDSKRGIADVKSSRFAPIKDVTPGPGQYDPDAPAGAKPARVSRHPAPYGPLKKQSGLSGGNTPNVSACSDVDGAVFRTPVWKGPRDGIYGRPQSVSSRRMTNAASGSSLGSKDPLDEVDWKKRCLELEEVIAKMRDDEKSSELRDAIEALKTELQDQRTSLDAKMESLQQAETERNELETKWHKVEDEKEENASRIESLRWELELLAQDNKTLEESAQGDRRRLEEERKGLEEKATFLHFTQEQLNQQVQYMDNSIKLLQQETHDLKEEVASLNHQLEAEKEKMMELMDTYVCENEEALLEFARLQAEHDQLHQEKSVISEQANFATAESSRLQNEVMELCAAKTVIQATLDDVLSAKERLQELVASQRADLEVSENDRTVLEEELQRVEKTKSFVELDLAQISAEKRKLEQDCYMLEEDKTQLSKEFMELRQKESDQKMRLEQLTDVCSELEARCHDSSQYLQVANVKLEAELRVVCEQASEIKELEMKNSSLEGSLSATESQVENLVSENKILTEGLEQSDGTLREFIVNCQELKDEVVKLLADKEDLNETCIIIEEGLRMAEKIGSDLRRELEMKELECMEATVRLNDAKEVISLMEIKIKTDAGKRDEEITNLQQALQMAKEDALSFQVRSQEQIHELNEGKTERKQLLEMSDDLSGQVSEHLLTIKVLQDKELELTRRVEKLKHELEREHQGLESELYNHWEAEEEIMHLQNEVERLNSEGCELRRLGELRRLEISELQTRLSNTESEKDNSVNELALLKQDLQGKEKAINTLEMKYASTDKQIKAVREELDSKETSNAKVVAELKAEMQSLLEVNQKSKSNLQALRKETAGFERIKSRYNEVEALLEDYLNENLDLKAKLEKLEPLKDSEDYKEKYETLRAMVEPFQQQLEAYELEKMALMERNDVTAHKLEKLSAEHAQHLGHQNHKQKINHLVKLKKENVTLLQENAMMKTELTKRDRVISRLETKLRDEGKENASFSTSMRYAKTPMLDPSRRQTVVLASTPLAPSNRISK